MYLYVLWMTICNNTTLTYRHNSSTVGPLTCSLFSFTIKKKIIINKKHAPINRYIIKRYTTTIGIDTETSRRLQSKVTYLDKNYKKFSHTLALSFFRSSHFYQLLFISSPCGILHTAVLACINVQLAHKRDASFSTITHTLYATVVALFVLTPRTHLHEYYARINTYIRT